MIPPSLDLLTFPPTDDPPISARWRAHWPTPPAQPTRDQNTGKVPPASVSDRTTALMGKKNNPQDPPTRPSLNFTTKRAFLLNSKAISRFLFFFIISRNYNL
ncbi:hypothetical protein FQA47_017086 [Oryzias melastigma]|uniref:Uncharacterized protein n=1 Tax=Oryzias melastigma TaxID=30732 RepID=A0A834BXM7_ORYME|nr:hypothetical protein FQA47_017086 [Oryzias melastigma]